MREYGLNDSQLGVYLDMLEDPATTKYNLPVLLALPEGVDRDRAWRAFADTVAAHPIYAATFAAGAEGRLDLHRLRRVRRHDDARIARVRREAGGAEVFNQAFALCFRSLCRRAGRGQGWGS